MECGLFALLVLVCDYFLVCDGHLSDAMTPCGPELCGYLCQTLKCSPQPFHVKNFTCDLRNPSLDVRQGRVRTCRNVTSRRGKPVHVCNGPHTQLQLVRRAVNTSPRSSPRIYTTSLTSPIHKEVQPGLHLQPSSKTSPIKKGPPVDRNGATINLGDAVNIDSPQKWYEAIYVGNDEVVMYDHQKQLATKRSLSSNTDPIEKYKFKPGQLRFFSPEKIAKRALKYYKSKAKNLPKRHDFITWCYTGKTYFEAYMKNCSFKL